MHTKIDSFPCFNDRTLVHNVKRHFTTRTIIARLTALTINYPRKMKFISPADCWLGQHLFTAAEAQRGQGQGPGNCLQIGDGAILIRLVSFAYITGAKEQRRDAPFVDQ